LQPLVSINTLRGDGLVIVIQNHQNQQKSQNIM